MRSSIALATLVLLSVAACEETPPPAAPVTPPAPPPPAAEAGGLAPPPATKVAVVTDDFGGLKVPDPYRWLEADDAEVKAWSDAQTSRARAYLDGWPGTAALKKRIGQLKRGKSAEVYWFIPRRGQIFALRSEPPAQQPRLVVGASPDDLMTARVVVDPNKIDPTGATAMDFYVPSLDGKLVAVSLSKGGSEAGDLHVYETATGKELPDVLPHVNEGTAGGSVAWNAKGTGFWYTRYPKKGERSDDDLRFYEQLWFHELGKPNASDVYVFGKDLPRIAEIFVSAREDGKYVLADVLNGDGGEHGHYLLDAGAKAAPWKELAKFTDGVETVSFGRDDNLYALSRKGSPRGRVVRTKAARPDLAKAEVVVPESDVNIRSAIPTAKLLYVVDIAGGPSRVRIVDLKTKAIRELPLPPVPSVNQVVRMAGDEVLYNVETFLEPAAWYRYVGAGEAKRTSLALKAPFDYADAEVLRETCTSKDGTRVPVSIVLKKGAPRDGARPTLLTGYGGYQVSLQPYFDDAARVMLDKGGVWAMANLRGGGEFGEAWHQGGMLLKKQNVFDDFAACAARLVELKLTNPRKLAIQGGSNGGLLMGAVVTQHPDIAAAVVSEVGIYDMMRSEFWPNGAFNVTEFGTVKDAAQRDALMAYSPYHHVKDGAAYPPILLTTGTNDPRVAPWQSRKFAARLQAAGGKAPVLLLTRDAGHGIGNSLEQSIADETDAFAFIFRNLGVE